MASPWRFVRDQAEADALLEVYGDFHDAILKDDWNGPYERYTAVLPEDLDYYEPET